MAHALTPAAGFTYATAMRRLTPFGFLAFAVILTWPLISKVTTHVPLGSEPAETVPFLNVWTIGWNGTSLANGYSGYWDAPIFYPTVGTFAFSDPQPLTSLAGLLLWPLSPALAYNTVLLAYLALTGYVTFRLLRQRELTFGPAAAGGLLVMALPFLTNERGVIQLQALFGPIWGIAALWALLDRSTVRRAVYLGLAVAVTFLASEYYALLLFPALALGFLVHTPSFRNISWRHVGLAGVIALILILPVGLSQSSRLQAMGFQRSESSFARTSARPADYLRPSSRLRIAEIAPKFDLPSNQRLYPGIVVAALAVLGLVVGLRKPGKVRRWAVFLLLVAALGFVFSLGSHLTIGGSSPLSILHRELPIVGYTRSAFRFGALAQLAIVLLAVGGLAWIWDRNRAVAAVLLILALVELLPKPERLVEVPDDEPAWASAMADEGAPVVVHIPWAPDRTASSFASTTRWMIEALMRDVRLVNGYSGFFPALNTQLRELLVDFPDDLSVAALEALGVDYVVLHDTIDSNARRRIDHFVELRGISEVTETEGLTVLRLPAGSMRSVAEYEGDWDLRISQRNDSPTLEAMPADFSDSPWAYVAGLTPLDWELDLIGEPQGKIQVNPKGALLFFEGSDDWLRLAADVPRDSRIDLIELDSGRVIGTLRNSEAD